MLLKKNIALLFCVQILLLTSSLSLFSASDLHLDVPSQKRKRSAPSEDALPLISKKPHSNSVHPTQGAHDSIQLIEALTSQPKSIPYTLANFIKQHNNYQACTPIFTQPAEFIAWLHTANIHTSFGELAKQLIHEGVCIISDTQIFSPERWLQNLRDWSRQKPPYPSYTTTISVLRETLQLSYVQSAAKHHQTPLPLLAPLTAQTADDIICQFAPALLPFSESNKILAYIFQEANILNAEGTFALEAPAPLTTYSKNPELHRELSLQHSPIKEFFTQHFYATKENYIHSQVPQTANTQKYHSACNRWSLKCLQEVGKLLKIEPQQTETQRQQPLLSTEIERVLWPEDEGINRDRVLDILRKIHLIPSESARGSFIYTAQIYRILLEGAPNLSLFQELYAKSELHVDNMKSHLLEILKLLIIADTVSYYDELKDQGHKILYTLTSLYFQEKLTAHSKITVFKTFRNFQYALRQPTFSGKDIPKRFLVYTNTPQLNRAEPLIEFFSQKRPTTKTLINNPLTGPSAWAQPVQNLQSIDPYAKTTALTPTKPRSILLQDSSTRATLLLFTDPPQKHTPGLTLQHEDTSTYLTWSPSPHLQHSASVQRTSQTPGPPPLLPISQLSSTHSPTPPPTTQNNFHPSSPTQQVQYLYTPPSIQESETPMDLDFTKFEDIFKLYNESST